LQQDLLRRILIRDPHSVARRTLQLSRGVTGGLEIWRLGKAAADMELDIERSAGLTVR
jgi:hypothetical protein